MATHTIKMKVDLDNLMMAAARESSTPALALGFQIASSVLRKIAERAIEIEDMVIIEHLETLHIIERTEEEAA